MMKPLGICEYWRELTLRTNDYIIGFYTHNPKTIYRSDIYKPEYSCFSNFYIIKYNLKFEIPEENIRELIDLCPWFIKLNNKKITIENSEKGIMLWKAILMNDENTFHKILIESEPSNIKHLGRLIRNWNEEIWSNWKEFVAYEVIRQKFNSDKILQKILKDTQDHILVEASPTDTIWGIGLSVEDVRIQNPKLHRGSNLLGSILMQIRSEL